MRLIVRILVLLFLIGLLLAIFAPSILSTRFGNNSLYKLIKSMSGYEIHSDSLKLHWLQGQEAHQIEVLDKNGRPVFRADSITSTAPLWKLLFYHDVGSLDVKSPFVAIDTPQQLASKLMVRQAGFSLAVSITPSMHLIGEIAVSQGSVQFLTPGLEPVVVSSIMVDALLLPKQIKLQSSGITSGQGSFQIDLLAFPGSHQIDADLTLSSFPLRAADQVVSILYPEFKGVIRETIGESFDAQLKLKNMQENLEIFFKAKSDFFSADLETTVQANTLQLIAPALFEFQIPAASFEKLTNLSIKNGVNAQIKIDQLSVPLQNRALMSIQGTLKSEALEFNEWTIDPFTLFVGSSEMSPKDWNVKIDSPQVQFQGTLALADQWENLSFNGVALLPKNTKLDLSAQSLKSITIGLQGDLWSGKFKGAFDPTKKTVTLSEPGVLSAQLENLPFSLPTLPVQVTVQPTTIYLDPLSGALKGSAEVDSFQLGATQVGSTSVQFNGNLKSKSADFILASTVGAGILRADGSFSYPSDLKMKGSCKDLPVASLQPFLKEGPSLLPLLGNSLTTNFQATLSETSRLVALSTSSPLLTLKAALKGSDTALELLEPASFQWTLTPDGYTALSKWLQGSAPLTLSQPAVLKGSIETLSFSFDQILESLKYQGKISSPELSFGSNKVSQLQAEFSHPTPATPHQFQITAKAAPQGTLSCQGSWTPPGTADIKLLLEQFPSATSDLFTSPFLGNRFSLGALCGPLLNLSLNTTLSNWSGPLKLELHSTNLRSSLQGVFTQGVLTLTDKFHLQMNITKELSKMIVTDGSSFRSEGPVTLEVAPKGFSYPLFPSNLAKLQVGAGRLELGKLMCQNEGNLQTTLGLLKKGQYRSGDELELWFAPLDFKIQNGVMNCERTEILLASEFQVCTWGNVDLPGDSVDGILGLTASCLKNAFGIKNLPENYVLQIPVYGSLSDVKIDKGKATTKIGALMLWQQKDALGGAIKGPAGKFLGGTLNQIGPLPGGDQKAPPPKKPFPWETNQPAGKIPSNKKTSEATKLIRPDDSPLKQVLKLIR